MIEMTHHQQSSPRAALTAALAVSVFIHGAAFVIGGCFVSVEKPSLFLMEVDLRLLAPAVPRSPVSTSSTPASPPTEKLIPRPQPEPKKQPKPTTRPAPEALSAPPPDPVPARPEKPKPQEVKELARADASGSETASRRGAPSFLAPVPRELLADYQRTLYRQIERAKRYPLQSRLNREEGTVKVRFVIASSGAVSEVKVIKSSGFDLIDRAAVAAVEDAAPFPPLPEGLSGSRLPVTVPIRFSLR